MEVSTECGGIITTGIQESPFKTKSEHKIKANVWRYFQNVEVLSPLVLNTSTMKPRFHAQIYNSGGGGDIGVIFPIVSEDALDSGAAEKMEIPIP
ncbi:MAG TPA: hypothetical protein VFZ55_01810 [Nitrososphaera sp.]